MRQERFCQEYVKCGNGAEAARLAGYSEDTARNIAAENLTKPSIDARIKELLDERAAAAAITDEWIVNRLKQNIERCMQTEPVYDSDGNRTGEYKHNAAAANRALELLGKRSGMFIERHEHSGANGGPIRTQAVKELTDDELDAAIAAEAARVAAAGNADGEEEAEEGED